jgi:hypothetical protein
MTNGSNWNPMPNNTARPTPKRTPRARGEELWLLSHDDRIASCELRNDTNVGEGFEVLVRHDDEPIIGRRCHNEAEARYYGETFRQDYARGGWKEAR